MNKLPQKTKIDNKEFVIRYITQKDTKGIFEMKKSLFKEKAMTGMNEEPKMDQTRKAILKVLENIRRGDFVDLVLEYDNRIVGRAFIRRIDDPCQSHVASFGIHVLDFLRGTGITERFFQLAEKEARKALKIKIITLGVMACNKRAIKFYKKNGFEKTGLVKGAIKYFNKLEDEVLMAKYYK